MAFSSTKLVSIFASVVALATMSSQAAVAQQAPRQNTTPPANSQQQNSQPQTIKDFLGLSDAQVEKIQSILIDRQQKIEKELTAQQRPAFTEGMRSGQNLLIVLQQLNLSQEQRTRIGPILQASSQQIKDVLTPEQLKKLEAQFQQNQQNQQNPPNQNRR
ncbi:hypothetical protein [Floridanema evergladense]|uniref:P pilus assembly/Cpx signaling pathway, periplasmic inhibitor/zinc-resistance associated protein n=1 Tax=Floridaenema evergladense BLCC-F167 TaxID=3153639 RepID=A0ABV4WG65_9CYAN